MAENTGLTDKALAGKHTGMPAELTYRTDNNLSDHYYQSDLWQHPDYYRAGITSGYSEDFSGISAVIQETTGIPAETIGVKRLPGQQLSIIRQWITVRSRTKGV